MTPAAVTHSTQTAQRQLEKLTLYPLAPVYDSPLKLDVEKLADLRAVTRLMDGDTGELDVLFDPPNRDELRLAKAERALRNQAKRQRALGKLRSDPVVGAQVAVGSGGSSSGAAAAPIVRVEDPAAPALTFDELDSGIRRDAPDTEDTPEVVQVVVPDAFFGSILKAEM